MYLNRREVLIIAALWLIAMALIILPTLITRGL